MQIRFFLAIYLCLIAPVVRAQDAKPATIRIGIYQGTGISKSSQKMHAALAQAPNLKVTALFVKDIQDDSLANFDVLLFPGGSGGVQGKTLGDKGRANVRAFVERGGGYVGVCAGAYLATNDYAWSLGILNAKVIDKKHWARGHGDVEIQLTPNGQSLLNRKQDKLTIHYYQGPLLAPGDDAKLPAYEKLANFATEIADNGAPKGIMIGTTAIGRAPFGKGRVICFSPHPELTPGLNDALHRAIHWAAGK